MALLALSRWRRSRRQVGALEDPLLEVAHDFNNLLTAIRGYSELLVKQSSGRSAEHAREILKASDRAAQLTRKLLTYTGRHAQRNTAVDVGVLVRELSGMFRRLLGPGIALELEVDGRTVAWGDSGALQQVLVNLVVNARDALPAGGTVRIAVRPCEPYVCVAVTDTGAGDAAIRERIFYLPAATDVPDALSA